MIEEDVLRCAVCSREVRIVRLVPGMLTLGHVQNPRQHHHAVRLSRAAADRSLSGSEDSQPQRRVSDPIQRTTATRGASDGPIPDRTRRRGRHSSGIASKSPAEAASNADPSRTPRLPLGLGPR